MASSKEFVQYVCDQMSAAAPVTYKSMFGEYGLFAEGKFFAVICDISFFSSLPKPAVPPFRCRNIRPTKGPSPIFS